MYKLVDVVRFELDPLASATLLLACVIVRQISHLNQMPKARSL
jgi:hypothetical protein